jgi:Pyridoxamine 5'-phosphate oxidase
MDAPRDRQQRRVDTLRKLETEPDVWVATASGDGTPYLVPLSLAWDGRRVVVCAQRGSRTIDNLLRSGVARLGLGLTRDVVILEVVVSDSWPARDVPSAIADQFATRADWDPRRDPGDYIYVALEPRRIQAWRESNELSGRLLMRDGAWLD